MQRAILLLREVLEWPTAEVAEWLNLSVPAVNSALQRARRALRQIRREGETPVAELYPQLQNLLDRYMALWQQADIPGLVALLRDDAWFTMPPLPAWFQHCVTRQQLTQSVPYIGIVTVLKKSRDACTSEHAVY
ncbi:MAG TPA: sigma factor-like helix-turn-helix DNA-binding protein [Ktedonobacteraceae bacterium]|nr:sigma factor-like helix-turn-helix DNA-binding protein [Ktedonobacteraceae bacterium]